jgi:hypothetical protein
MINAIEVRNNLRIFAAGYRKTRSAKGALFFSKYAILETCGWIEEAMDEIVLTFALRKLGNPDNAKSFKEKVRSNSNMGINNLRKLLIELIGLVNLERLETMADPAKVANLYADLSHLHPLRNTEAHTHINGIIRNIDAPTVTRARLDRIYDGLVEIEITLYKI